MCAEALPSQCHRSLISDALSLRDVDVQHILAAGRTERHRRTPWAVADHGRLTYPFSLHPNR
jgi:uncharacterized protein (DUF488 family)